MLPPVATVHQSTRDIRPPAETPARPVESGTPTDAESRCATTVAANQRGKRHVPLNVKFVGILFPNFFTP
jgi:hypothetical protein